MLNNIILYIIPVHHYHYLLDEIPQCTWNYGLSIRGKESTNYKKFNKLITVRFVNLSFKKVFNSEESLVDIYLIK
jgi:hypothetical protein